MNLRAGAFLAGALLCCLGSSCSAGEQDQLGESERCGPIAFEKDTEAAAPELVGTIPVELAAGTSKDVPVHLESGGGGVVMVLGEDPSAISGSIDGRRLESTTEGAPFPRGTLLGEVTGSEGLLSLTNKSHSAVRVSVAILSTSGRHLSIATDRSTAGHGDPLCIEVKLEEAQQDDKLSLAVQRNGKPPGEIAVTESGVGHWSAVWHGSEPGNYRLVATVGGARPRYAEYAISVGSGAANIQQGVTASSRDKDHDGLIDELDVVTTIEVNEPGDYALTLHLRATGGGGAGGTAFATLRKGLQTVSVPVDGQTLSSNGATGTLEAVNVILIHMKNPGEDPQDEEPGLGVLPGNYRADMFEQKPPLKLSAPTPVPGGLLGAVSSLDATRIEQALQFTSIKCLVNPPPGGPPPCPPSVEEGTPVEAFLLGGCQGSWVLKSESKEIARRIASLAAASADEYAVIVQPLTARSPQEGFQVPWRIAIFGTAGQSANSWTIALDRGIVGALEGCGQTPEMLAEQRDRKAMDDGFSQRPKSP